MATVLSATEARVHFGEVMDRVADKGERIIVEHRGKRRMVMIPMDDLPHLPAEGSGARARLAALHAKIREELNGRPLEPEPVEMLRRVRNEEFE
jgi:prevent-host-death family protein